MESLKQQTLQFSLKENTKQRICDMFYDVKEKFPNVACFILILDENTSKIISNAIKMIDLIDKGINVVEKLELARKPFPKQHAIYFLSPRINSIEKLLQDFSNSKQLQYGVVHLFFSNAVTQELIKKIQTSSELLKRVQTFKELNLDFICPDPNNFSLNMQEFYGIQFQKENYVSQEKLYSQIASKITTILPSLEKYYEFEILYNINPNNNASKGVSEQLQLKIKQHIDEQNKTENELINKNSGKVTILVVDRTVDLTSPILHDLYYQPMLYDLLNIKNDTIEEAESLDQQKKLIFLTHEDEIYNKLRYVHIANVMESIPKIFRDFTASNPIAQQKLSQISDQSLDLKKMIQITQSMPEYNEIVKKLTTHINLAQKLFDIYKEKDLNGLGEIEYQLVTGINDQCETVKEKNLLEQIRFRLSLPKLTKEEKLRLVFTVFLAMDVDENNRKQLVAAFGPEELSILYKLKKLGITMEKSKNSLKVEKQIKEAAIKKENTLRLKLCRHTPHIEFIAQHVLNSISRREPATNVEIVSKIKLQSLKINEGASTAAGGKDVLSLKKNRGQALFETQSKVKCNKLIVFMIGGISYSEIKAIRNIQYPSNILLFVGSTSFLTPSSYIKALNDSEETF